jgi:pimeloyl-ACP methyl ester carboxylesterase
MTLPLLRGLFGALSLAVLTVALYLLVTWATPEVIAVDGVLVRTRDEWRLWWGAGLLAWSALGRTAALALLARPGGARFSRAKERVTAPGGLDTPLHVETAGPREAPTIILTHGWGMDATVWTPQRRALEADFRLILWDLPGCGSSRPVIEGAITLEAFADSLARVLALSPGPVVLVGHSIGGMIIQTLARDRPELFVNKIAGIVLLNTTHTNPLRTMILPELMRSLQPALELGCRVVVMLEPLFRLQAWQSYLSGATHIAMRFGFGPRVNRRDLDHVALLATRNPPGSQARGNLAMFRWDGDGALADLATPMLVMGGEADVVTTFAASRTIATTSRNARLETVAGGNHMSSLDEPEVYSEAIARFARAVFQGGSLASRSDGGGLDGAGVSLATPGASSEWNGGASPPG